MLNILLWMLAVSYAYAENPIQKHLKSYFGPMPTEVALVYGALHNPLVASLYPININEVRTLLQTQPTISDAVVDKVIASLSCASQYQVQYRNILTVIDYSLPSNQKRFWVFNLREKRMLFHTYVSHGITSGGLQTNYFSNVYNSKASSLGVYKTKKAYYGREGLSLQLRGMDRAFNDNAENRAIVMHGGWYVKEGFIQKYGRAGRSWGCPAIPPELSKPIINTIKDSSFFVVYYPSEQWLTKSKFLNCQKISPVEKGLPDNRVAVGDEPRGGILFADLHAHKFWQENDPVVVISADNYQRFLKKKAPVGRMLRRQINQVEYIVINSQELGQLMHMSNEIKGEQASAIYSSLGFVVPDIVQVRGYYETLMKPVQLGKIKNIQLSADSQYLIELQSRSAIHLKSTDQFIRWVGL